MQAKAAEECIHATFDKLRDLLGGKEADLIIDVEMARHQKEKELLLQKEDLEFVLNGIRQSATFTETMLKEGTETEIAASTKQVVARFTTLERERGAAKLEPAAEATIELEGEERGIKAVGEVINEIVRVVTQDISPEKSLVVKSAASFQINQPYSFKVVVVNKKGNGVTGKKGQVPFDVEVTGPSNAKVLTLRL